MSVIKSQTTGIKTAAGNFRHPGSLFFEADNIIRRTANGAAQLLRREQCDVPLATARGPLLIRADLLFSMADTAGYLWLRRPSDTRAWKNGWRIRGDAPRYTA